MTYIIDPQLLNWMREHNGLHDYDGVMALSEDQLNAALAKQHRTRLVDEEVPTNIKGVVAIKGTNISYRLAGYQMSAPTLAISRGTRFDIASQLDSGMLVKTTKPLQIEAVSQHDALDPMEQTCDLPLVSVLSEPLLQLDVAASSNMRLAVGDSEEQRQYGGEFIQAQMQEQADLNQPYVLASMGQDQDDALDIKQIDLRVQENAKKGHDLLLWAATKQGKVGQLPSNGDVPGLDPDVTTVLASARLMHRISYGKAFIGMLEGGSFEETRDSEGMLVGLRATQGHLTVPDSKYSSAEYYFQSDTFQVQAKDGLSIAFADSTVDQIWKSQCTIDFHYRPVDGGKAKAYQATFALDLVHRFNLAKGPEKQGRVLQGQLYSPRTAQAQVTAQSGLPELPADERAQIEEFVAHIVKRAIVTGLSKKLDSSAPERWLAGMQVGLDKGAYLQASDVPDGNDVAMITTSTAFSIEPSSAVVLPGKSCEFRIVPPRSNVRWYVVSLPVSANNPGYMEQNSGETGTYQAALSPWLAGKPSKVMVVAADVLTGSPLASALVTTVPRAVTVNPMIHTCEPEGILTLTAGSLAGGDLKWEILDPVEGESGSLSPEAGGKRCRYEAAKATDKPYVIDEIRVQDMQSGDHCTAYVLVVKTTPSAVVRLKEPPKEDGSLELVFNLFGDPLEDVKWKLPIAGQGSFIGGRYQPAEVNKAGFVLVFAEGLEGKRTYQGHLILPWPLTDFPELSQELLAQPS
ncbi:hypothetical protein [Pseudomonas guariconensis]|uniref:hypothetical protein n=1 Tax=Pseudomonas guariconensis TaxID=1288410 RepID=UPI0018A91C63|nr:hypothetical protein [Pseudomonas guariconensis]MBF8743050.1 hypothetical protein [Pseudomonas guariconensis]MBF8753044.1 hypothetical protein [Pseudomonas guariconensis]